jgi:hypothetical protein
LPLFAPISAIWRSVGDVINYFFCYQLYFFVQHLWRRTLLLFVLYSSGLTPTPLQGEGTGSWQYLKSTLHFNMQLYSLQSPPHPSPEGEGMGMRFLFSLL